MRFIYTRGFKIGFSIFAGVAFLVIFDRLGYLGLAHDAMSRGIGSVSNVLAAGTTTTKEYFSTLVAIRKLVSENASLKQQISDLSFENARLRASREENTTLRKSLNFRQQSEFNMLPVEVILADPTGFRQTLTIDQGESEGVKLNSAVIVAPGLLVGKVTALNPHSAVVTLITDPSVLVNAEVSDSGAKGLVSGAHGLALSFDLVSQNEVIKTQDKVVTSGLSGDFPRGLLIGQIDSIQSQPSDLFQKAFVAPAADLRNLRFLFVIQ